MTVTTQTVREIALENPASIRIFESFGIDYCCGVRKPLAEACEARNRSVDAVIAALETNREPLVAESADLIYHLLVLLKSRGVSLEEVEAVLSQRTSMSGLEEKASRKKD